MCLRFTFLFHFVLFSLTIGEEHRLRVSENRVLRRIFGRKREEVAGGWRRLHNEELHNLYASPNVIRVIKLRRMRWMEQITRMGGGGGDDRPAKVWLENLNGRDHSEDLDIDERVILQWVLRK
jgi:hypothetical protein